MIFSDSSGYMLKYQKTKAKLAEYDISKNEFPRFPSNSNELSYPVIYILSRYAESVIENNAAGKDEFFPHLTAASQYFDAAVGGKDRSAYDSDFLLSGAAAYFLSADYGSAKVLSEEYFERAFSALNVPQHFLATFLGYLLSGKDLCVSSNVPSEISTCRLLNEFYNNGTGIDNMHAILKKYRADIYRKDDPMEIYYVDILCAVIISAVNASSWKLLPSYSQLDLPLWENYLRSSKAPKMLWPAQQLIGKSGIFRGKSAVVQLPTGVGKTKSIELILRSAFISGRTATAIIVAPLRALCNEIANDMANAFENEAIINQFSDILENDFSLDTYGNVLPTILICTPEKLSYIIHHQASFIEEIGLFIFDEGHMFDEGSRGAFYELMLSDIRDSISSEKQIVLLSAVLSNAKQIQEWLLGENGIWASDPQIKATPKTVGFISQTRDIHYYSDDPNHEDFFVPRSIDVTLLNNRPRERKKRFFPDLSSANDIAIYYSEKLCNNGGAAIFANRTITVRTVIERLIELKDRGYELQKIKANSDNSEMKRLATLMADYYGEHHPYTVACSLGVAPHYSNLPNGLRLAIENAFRNKKMRLVVCTSTLAQGVNIPIKYLFMTNFSVSNKTMSVRSFQNLMGRTARSGMYTEGSVIVTNPLLYDNQNDRKHGGYYKWNDCIKMFDSSAAEPCGSSILSLVHNIPIDYEIEIDGTELAQFIANHLDEADCFDQYANMLTVEIQKRHPQKSTDSIQGIMRTCKDTVGAIENHLCFAFSSKERDEEQISASEICKKTFAYFMATEAERILLEKIFYAVASKINRLNQTQIIYYAKAMIGIDLSVKIETWVHEKQIAVQAFTSEQLLEMIIRLFAEIHLQKLKNIPFADICHMWLEGRSFTEMENQAALPIAKLEEICSKTLSYELSFFVGNIIDVVDINNDCPDSTVSDLQLLQQRLRYGVKNETAVSICEKVFNDRFLANKLSDLIGNDMVKADNIIGIVQLFQTGIFEFLQPYPSYFSERIARLCDL